MTEEKTGEGPKKYTRRKFLEIAGKTAGGILLGAELAACRRGKTPEYGDFTDPKNPKYYTVRLEHLEEEFGHIRKEPHMQGEIDGEVPTRLGLTVNNVQRVWGSETGASRGLTTFEDGQSRGYWYKGLWPSKEKPEEKIEGYISSQFATEIEEYEKPKE